jgi:inorganic pyrophosphatase
MSTQTVVIETPRGRSEKFAFDPEAQAFVLRRVLPVGMVFPYDFGFVPETLAEDGDPVDVVVLSEFESFPGCRIECRIIGALLARQTRQPKKKEPKSKQKRSRRMIRNDRLIAVPAVASALDHVRSIDDLPDGVLSELEQFFVNYHEQEGTRYEPRGRASAREAKKLLARHEK